MQAKQLSKSDARVLQQVFDPESSLNTIEIIIDPALPADRHIQDPNVLEQLKTSERNAVALVEAQEKDKSHTSKHDAFEASVAVLNACIETYPAYASARNNRAQLYRWRYGDAALVSLTSLPSDEFNGDVATTVVTDLQTAISLASPPRPQDAVSPSQGRLLAQAYTQLGALYHTAAKHLQRGNTVSLRSGAMSDWDADKFAEEASRDFQLGGVYGSEVAKALAVYTNPHAKLCGNMVKEAMRKEMGMAPA